MTDTARETWTEHYFTVDDGTKLHWVEMGAGTPVVLIHGAGGSAVGNWFVNGIAPALASTNRVIGLDMRGHGLSEDGPEGGRQKMASDVVEFLDQQGIDKAHIGGYSMGGFVTAGVLATRPDRFLSASFGGSGLTEVEEWADSVPKDKDNPAPDEAAATARFRSRPETPGQEVGNATRTTRPAPVLGDRSEFLARQRALSASIDVANLDIPILAINGEYDRPYAKTHRLWREARNFTNVVLPDKGHLSAIMRGFIPEQYVESMVAFITTNNP
ncbi:MAG: alpha/beta fold hydrolase [Acidimicrobiales bacterium]